MRRKPYLCTGTRLEGSIKSPSFPSLEPLQNRYYILNLILTKLIYEDYYSLIAV